MGKKPSIAQLQKLLDSDEDVEITILPNGGVVTKEKGAKVKTGDLKPLTFREHLGGEYGVAA